MSGTTIRSSSQLYIDADLDLKSKKLTSVANGTVATDGVNLGQLQTAVLGLNSSIHVPVADLAAAKAVPAIDRQDREVMLIETLGLYRYDLESAAASNDNTVIRPTDIASDATAGRWIKISSSITDHDNMSAISGNGMYHLSLAERDKLTGIEAAADVTDAANVGSSIHGAGVKTLPLDAEFIPLIDSAAGNTLAKVSWVNVKAFLKTYFDTLYNKYVHPNHTGDVTSAADGAQTIAANVVTNAKLADVATQTIKGRTTAATGDPEDLSPAQVRAMLNVADGANNYAHPNHSGDVTSAGDGAQTIAAKAVTLTKMADMATASFIGRNTAAVGVPEVLPIGTVKTMLGLNTNNLSSRTYRATPGGTVNGSLTTFTIAALVLSGTEEVFKNGMLMNAGAGNDYTIAYGATTTITFLTAPSNTPFTDVILVNYSV
jgi:hypothetical protein